jgi:16S rRNA (guanine966-N2)-methyltransferase
VDRPFLDLAAGTGAVGLEALSRGARPVWLVEENPAVLRVLRRNLELLGVEAGAGLDVVVIPADVGAWLTRSARAPAPAGGGVVYLDPPYGTPQLERWIRLLVDRRWLDEETLVIVEHRSGSPPPLSRLVLSWTRRYGDTSLTAAVFPGRFREIPEDGEQR